MALSITALILGFAACASSDDGAADDSVPAVTAPSTLVPPHTEVPDDAPAGDGGVTTIEGEEGTATTQPAVSDQADLPVAPPPSSIGSAPPSTTPGPLPEPSVALVAVGDFDQPVEIGSRPQDDRLFVVEQPGRIVAVDDLDTEVVLDISGSTSQGSEQGLLGVAFHPERELAYINYTDRNGDTIIAEYVIDPVTAVFDPESVRIVLTIPQPFSNHNGGELAFGPDRLLYIGVGDGGSGGDPERNGLDLSTPLGKILRIDPLSALDGGFGVPDDNPFVDVGGADPTIWSYGLRNPWRFSFDPLTGDLWIADVGQNAREEIDHAAATNGRNAGRGLGFGWSAFEGDSPFNGDQPVANHTAPVVVYGHDGGNCSVSGGAVYRGELVPALQGWYVFGDFCSGTIWGYDPTSAGAPRVLVLAEQSALAAIAAGADGELYSVSNNGRVARFVPA
ncbi:MAG: PQQ-dependent sugar dehydrogenase [Acidimicrobiia bacterium]|nr:PQQ-dependent sugar dehydrogenase [Acidimicrobiia bacterium]